MNVCGQVGLSIERRVLSLSFAMNCASPQPLLFKELKLLYVLNSLSYRLLQEDPSPATNSVVHMRLFYGDTRRHR